MANKPWPAGNDVLALLDEVKEKNHHPRIAQAKVALAFVDTKAFVKDRFNWGKASKLSAAAQLLHPKDKVYTFQIILPADGWYQVLQGDQKEAWLDLHLSRFRPEMLPAMIEENGKAKPIKDKFGRIEYTNEIKVDEKTGSPIWHCDPLDLHVFADNASRYGVWCETLQDFKSALDVQQEKNPEENVKPAGAFANHFPPEDDTPYEYLKKLGVGMD